MIAKILGNCFFYGLLNIRTLAFNNRERILEELIKEHGYARQVTKSLVKAKEAYANGCKDTLPDITRFLEELALFYPKHIKKEDKHFFLPVMSYFSGKEQANMLEEFWEFDKNLIHEKYRTVVEEAEKMSGLTK